MSESRKIWLRRVGESKFSKTPVFTVQNNFSRDMNYGHCGGRGMMLMHSEKLALAYARSTGAEYLGIAEA